MKPKDKTSIKLRTIQELVEYSLAMLRIHGFLTTTEEKRIQKRIDDWVYEYTYYR